MAMKPIEILIEAKTTGNSEVDALNKRLDDLAAQQALIDSFVKIKKETQEAAAAFAAAQDKAQQLGRELATTSAPTKTQAAEFARAREAVNGTKDAYQSAQLKLQGLRGALKDNNIETTGLTQKQAALRKGVSEVETSVAGATSRLKEMGAAGPKAVGDTAQATDRATKSANSYQGALTQVASAVAGAFAVGKVVDYAKSMQEVSDQYKNLEAKIRLAIGAQGDLQSSVRGVGEVAQATHSSLDGTAQLFGRLAASAKELNITNTEALGITKTINQAIQVSGASAQASEAAVIQLVQALQSGVLRGDEFNSIMEQAPRLSKALADGLGVPVGALRALAEQGQLTSAKVVQALKGQSEAIDKEFSTLPLTVGRALTNLQTQWTLFIGGLTGGAAQSSIAAQGINALANNLDTLAGVAARAGSVLTAALAVQGVQALRAFAVEMAATGKAASLLSLELSKVPKVINITVAAVGFEVGFQIGEMLHENSELARKLGVGMVGYFEATVSGLQYLKEAAAAIFTSDTLDAAFVRFEARNNAIRDNIAGLWKDAETAPSKVGAAADASAGSLGKLGGVGAATGEAIAAGGAHGAAGVGKVGRAADDARGALAGLAAAINKAAPPDSFKDIIQNLKAAKDRGVDLDRVLRSDLPSAIDKLSGPELAKFRSDFIRSMDDAGIKGRAVQTGLALIGEQAAKSLGVDAVVASNKLGQEFVQANEKMRVLILSMPALKAAGMDAAGVVGQALSKMVDGAKSQAEIDAVVERVKALRKELGDKVANGLLDQAKEKADALKDAFDAAAPGINSVREAMKALGITSDETLKKTAATAKEAYDTLAASGTSSAREVGEAFKKTAEAAIAANNGIAPSWVQAQAAARGYVLEVDAAGKTTVKSMKEAEAATKAVGVAAKSTADNYKLLGEHAEQASAQVRKLAEAGQMLAAAEQLRQDIRNKDLEASKFMNRGNMNPVDAVPTFNSREEADAWLAETKKQYQRDNPFTTKSSGALGNAGMDLTMAEWRAEVDALAKRDAMKNAGAGPGRNTSTTQSPNAGTSTTTVNITVEGTTRSINTDAQGAATLQELVRQLAQAKGTALR